MLFSKRVSKSSRIHGMPFRKKRQQSRESRTTTNCYWEYCQLLRKRILPYVCRKLYQHQFTKEDMVSDIQNYYAASPKTILMGVEDGNRTLFLSGKF